MADFIDREAITEYLMGRIKNYREMGDRLAIIPLNFAMAHIKSLPAADVEPVRRWIPCSERLPGNGEDVLCWYEYFRFGEYNRMFRTFGIGYQYNGFWGGEVSKGQNAKVLAWMPLPEPPKEGGR